MPSDNGTNWKYIMDFITNGALWLLLTVDESIFIKIAGHRRLPFFENIEKTMTLAEGRSRTL